MCRPSESGSYDRQFPQVRQQALLVLRQVQQVPQPVLVPLLEWNIEHLPVQQL